MISKIGVLGLGRMGAPMAKHLLARGFRVSGYDPLESARSRALGLGIEVLDSPREAARPGLIVALGSTVPPGYARGLAERLSSRLVTLLDIPLARGEAAAVEGKLLIYGAGDKASFEACRPAFAAFASDIFHLGPAGAGQVGKMVNKLILWACTAANDEGLRLAQALGLDAERLRDALHHGSAQNWAMDQRAERSGMPWAEKDMSIVLHEADLARLALPLSASAREAIKDLKIRMGLAMPQGPSG